MLYFRNMPFAFSWEVPAAVIGALAVLLAAFAGIVMIARTHHGPSHGEIAILAALVVAGVWAWNTRIALAQRFFADVSGVMEEEIAQHLRTYGDCAAFVAQGGQGRDDGRRCVVRVLSARGRQVTAAPPRKSFESACDVTAWPDVRAWVFEAGARNDWCTR